MSRGLKRQQSTAVAIKAAEKRKRALELRRDGHTFDVIAKKMGINSGATAWKMVTKGIRDLPKQAAQEVVDLEIIRLDHLLVGLFERFKKGSHGSVDRILRVMTRRAALLGLDAPKAQHVQMETIQTVISQFDERSAPDNEYYALHGCYPEEAPIESEAEASEPSVDHLKGLH